MIVARIISVLIGYAFGLFQTGYIYGRAHGIDVRTQGSGNAGTTNTMRVLGKKAGIITFIGDFLKAFLAVVVVHLVFRNFYDEGAVSLLGLYGGFGAVLGHNFPFYLKFRGGKGIASTTGMILGVCVITGPICAAAFVIFLLATRYVSVGSMAVVISLFVQTIVFGQLGWLAVSDEHLVEFYILMACFMVMAIARHHANIGRLIHGTEPKIGQKKAAEAK